MRAVSHPLRVAPDPLPARIARSPSRGLHRHRRAHPADPHPVPVRARGPRARARSGRPARGASKNVTGSEEFFEGHFPGAPVMPGVLLMEGLAQAAGIWLLQDAPDPAPPRGPPRRHRRGQVPPAGGARRPAAARGHACCTAGAPCAGCAARCARASTAWPRPSLLLQVATLPAPESIPRARGPAARLGAGRARGRLRGHRAARSGSARGTIVDAARRGRRRHRRSARTTTSFPSRRWGSRRRTSSTAASRPASRSATATSFREFVTLHRGTAGGGGLTRIGSDNLFMAYAHVAHDCHVGSHTIFANGATLAGHVEVDGLRDHRRLLGRAPVLPRGHPRASSAATRWRPRTCCPTRRRWATARGIYGVNTIGLQRRGLPARGDRGHPPRLPRPAAEPAQHQRGAGAPRERSPMIPEVRLARRDFIRSRPARRDPAAAPAATRSPARGVTTPAAPDRSRAPGPDRRQRPLPVPGRGGGARARGRAGGGGGHQGRGRPRRSRPRWTRSTGSGSASSAAASTR